MLRAVQAGARRLVAVAARAGRELLAELLGDHVGLQPVDARAGTRDGAIVLAADLARRPAPP